MADHHPISTTQPLFSVIIAVYNDWALLDRCLASLTLQTGGTSFEVIIVDDGSTETAPDFASRNDRYLLTIIREPHAGISAARNRGIRESQGTVLVFVDADCRLREGCLAQLNSTITEFPRHDAFQLHIIGDCSSLVGRAEELRLATLQDHMLQPDARIRYLNTSGFAIRRSAVGTDGDLFDPIAQRAEDTLLLATLIKRGELPLFVPGAVVQHAPPLSLVQCIRKDFRSVFLVGKTYEIIAAKGVKFRLSNRERWTMFQSMWKRSRQNSIGRTAWFVVMGRRVLRLIYSFSYRCFRALHQRSEGKVSLS